jgi:ubiquinone/menaquinone biosynthesis C-methylase UbiE
VSLREAWEREAADWITFARHHDDYAWRFNIPAFLELVPPPGRLTLDLGCGEGRVARELARRGHRVLGMDSSASLVEAATAADEPIEAIEADLTAVPLEDGAADLAVSFMVLQSVDDLDAAVREASRLLAPEGRLCIAVVHPVNSLDDAPGWFDQHRFEFTREAQGARMTFHDVHRPLAAYFNALEAAGMLVEALREPLPGRELLDVRPEAEKWSRRPCFLHLRAVKAQLPFRA